MTSNGPTREELQRILEESRIRSAEIRRRMDWIERHRRELWKRLDLLSGQAPPPVQGEASPARYTTAETTAA